MMIMNITTMKSKSKCGGSFSLDIEGAVYDALVSIDFFNLVSAWFVNNDFGAIYEELIRVCVCVCNVGSPWVVHSALAIR